MENGNEKRIVRVGSRTSTLAVTQTNMIIDLLREKNNDVEFKLVIMDTIGDTILNMNLYKIGNSSLFTKELELALLADEVDFVVHSLKDVPTSISNEFIIGSVSMRETCDDAVVFKINSEYKSLSSLPNGSIVGTSSVRRTAQLKKKFPQLEFVSIRGNLNTRLLKLDDPEKAFKMRKGDNQKYDAIILAKAGLERLNWAYRISETLSYDDTLYAVGQGALACECRYNDIETRKLLATINDEYSILTCIVERTFLHKLDGGCSTPIGVRTYLKENQLIFQGCLMSLDGSNTITNKIEIELPNTTKSSSEAPKNGHKSNQKMNGVSHLNFTGIDIYGIDSQTKIKIETCAILGVNLANSILFQGGDKILNEIKLKQSNSANTNV
uniref:hydroxymethylbilane synthase n=1 Tax=Dugesia japonica TaxID=6161 RepID=A0A2R4LGK7_DUGJA|nr:porphobilinogen deaminase [Dugesia japonica]